MFITTRQKSIKKGIWCQQKYFIVNKKIKIIKKYKRKQSIFFDKQHNISSENCKKECILACKGTKNANFCFF